jgi:hypothetical protein
VQLIGTSISLKDQVVESVGKLLKVLNKTFDGIGEHLEFFDRFEFIEDFG